MRYKYQAVDTQKQEVSGILTADSEREAARQLQRRGLTPLSLTQVDSSKTSTRGKGGKPKQRDILIVLHELATLLESGVALIEAVESLANSSHHPFITQTFADIASELRQGITFSVTLQASPLKLPWYVTQLVEAGEITGKVAHALRDAVAQMEYDTRVADEMRNAMIYPIILIVSGIAAVLMIFIIVVPRFASMLKNRGDDIPLLAKLVLNTGMFFNTHVEWVIGIIVALVIMAVYLLSQSSLRAKLKDFSAKLPLLGLWIIEAETARWAAMMSTLLENRVSLLQSLELARQSIKLPSLNAQLSQVTQAVKSGTSLSQALQDNDALTPTGHNLIRAGEKAGELSRMLRSLAKLLEEGGRVRMKRFLLLIEPVAILIIGGVIGLIITGVILAITSVNQIGIL
ncbi:type II secretion system F family protein [Candidatus Parabeggiatoa sp. HSG14]|uniref:type II secretion system F family protein n=1 Tax=Candidatus Parabeggiatoa sp. HSG14 TaxID=3055593 RepID=UPI0025A8C311|nr:type II secretion system F family protein [Thiotrichales bacterium HSG14]